MSTINVDPAAVKIAARDLMVGDKISRCTDDSPRYWYDVSMVGPVRWSVGGEYLVIGRGIGVSSIVVPPDAMFFVRREAH